MLVLVAGCLGVLRGFLVGRKQRVLVEGVFSSVVDVVSGVPQGSVLGPLLFLLYTGDLPCKLENPLVGYADDSTILARVARPSCRPSVVASLNRDLVRVNDWCCEWGMSLNVSKTNALFVSRSRTLVPSFPNVVLNNCIIDPVNEVKILGVTIDEKLTFEKHLRSVARSASSRLGLMRRARYFFDSDFVSICFWSFILPVLEYGSTVWASAAQCHLALLDSIVHRAISLTGGELKCDLAHRRRVASLSLFYRIRENPSHPMFSGLPPLHVPVRNTRSSLVAHRFSLQESRCRTSQFQRSFVPRCVSDWNLLNNSVFDGDGLSAFKSRINRYFLLG